VTTATRRLRRASIAGLATIATVGGGLALTGGTAFAAAVTVTQQIGTTTATTVNPGATGVGLGDLDVDFANSFAIGDTITVQLANAPGCGTTNGAVGFSALPTVTATGPTTTAFGTTAGSATDTLPAFNVVTQSSAGACTVAGVKDQLLITLTKSSTGTGTDHFQVGITGQKVNVGSAAAAGAVTESANGAGPTTVSTVSFFGVTTKAVGAAPSAAAVALQPITVTDVPGGQVGTQLVFTLDNSSKFANAPTLSTPTGVTASAAAEAGALPSATLTYTLTGTTPANGKYTLSGATANLGATAGDTTVTVATGAGPTNIGSGAVAVTAATSRQSGADRYATAAALFPTAGTKAVLVSGVNFPDALSANYLAGVLNNNAGADITGILLTDPNALPSSTSAILTSKFVDTVYIVGGSSAVSDSVASAIGAMHVGNNASQPLIKVVRLAGTDRYATNRAVDLYAAVNLGNTSNMAVVATGENFADALSVGPAVAWDSLPLVLTTGASLNASAQQTLSDLALSKNLTDVVIAGGTAAVSSNVETQITSLGLNVANRFAGTERTGTAAAVAAWETDAVNGLGFPFTAAVQVNVARGDTFPDALAAGALAGWNGQVILLAATPTTLGPGAPTFLTGNGGVVTKINAFGGTAAVSDAVLSAAVASLS